MRSQIWSSRKIILIQFFHRFDCCFNIDRDACTNWSYLVISVHLIYFSARIWKPALVNIIIVTFGVFCWQPIYLYFGQLWYAGEYDHVLLRQWCTKKFESNILLVVRLYHSTLGHHGYMSINSVYLLCMYSSYHYAPQPHYSVSIHFLLWPIRQHGSVFHDIALLI
jgi:hypothetical protein